MRRVQKKHIHGKTTKKKPGAMIYLLALILFAQRVTNRSITDLSKRRANATNKKEKRQKNHPASKRKENNDDSKNI